jgi:hypothetical protein
MIMVAVCVDDCLVFSNIYNEVIKLKTELKKQFKVREPGEVKECLGMKIVRNRKDRTMNLDHKKYINELLQCFGMEDSKLAGTPTDMNQKLSSTMKDESMNSADLPHQQLIGSLMLPCSLNDIRHRHATNVLSQFNNNFKHDHWKATKRVLTYLHGTCCCLLFQRTDEKTAAYVVPDLTGGKQDHRSFEVWRGSNLLRVKETGNCGFTDHRS